MWDGVQKLINTCNSFLITSHVNPDGDAIGSEMALKPFLEGIGKNVKVVNASPTPATLAFLDPAREIVEFRPGAHDSLLEGVDAVFILDLNNWEQLGEIAEPLRQSTLPRVCIDHHEGADDDFAGVMVTDTSFSATGLMIYGLIAAMGGAMTPGVATALYAAIITDTGTFRFSNTDARTLTAAAELVEAGASPFEIHRAVFASKSWGAARLLGPVLGSVESAADGRLAWIRASREVVSAARASYDDMDGFVDLVRAIKGVELVLFFKETQDGTVKVSVRSNGKVNAYAVASGFGGGGHRMASGMRLDGPLDAAVEKAVGACLQMDGIRG